MLYLMIALILLKDNFMGRMMKVVGKRGGGERWLEKGGGGKRWWGEEGRTAVVRRGE